MGFARKIISGIVAIGIIFGGLTTTIINNVSAGSEVIYSISYEKGLKRGDIFDLTVSIENNTNKDVNAQTLKLYSPTFVGLLEDEIAFDTVEAGDLVSKKVKAVALEGGSEDVYLLNASGARIAKCDVRVAGKGYYAGDGHSHSTWSDGQNSVTLNARNGAYAKGLDFLWATDHNNLQQKIEVNKFNLEDALRNEFVCLYADEVTFSPQDVANMSAADKANTALGHGLAYGIETAFAHNAMGFNWYRALDFLEEQEGHFLYFAHPFLSSYPFDERVLYEETDRFIGVEIVNESHCNSSGNKLARDFWDLINSRGEKHYYALANSDAHQYSNIGNTYNKGMLEELTAENITALWRTGERYMSNGTDIRFDIGGKSNGQVLKINGASETTNLHIEISNRDYKLESVVVYKLDITGRDEVSKTTVFEKDLTADNTYFFEKDMEITVTPNTFYRMEAYATDSTTAKFADGFAFSNPIWVESASASNVVNYGTYSATGLVDNERHGKYINVGEDTKFDASQFSVTGGTNSSVTYKAGGNNKAGLLTVTYTAANGSKVVDEIFVVDKAAFSAVDPGATPPAGDQPTDEPTDQKGGCGAGVGLTSTIVMPMLSVLGATFIIKRNKKKENI